ncbi:MAG: hypothetical protein VB104_09100 [Candidatus Limiplasma sp.]|nr:hypothetical protein [Candidatus Limiplasma sp.]
MEKSGFFNSSSGDRVYSATDFAAYFGKLVSNGIFYAAPTNLQVTPDSGMAVSVVAGSAWINGYSYENTDALTLNLTTASGVNPRIDRVVVRFSAVERRIYLAVLTGTPAETPTAPALTRSNDTYEIGLADILVPKGSVTISAINLTDTRLNTALCGLVNSLVTAVYE